MERQAYGQQRLHLQGCAKGGRYAYKIELLGDMNISATFNVRDLITYIEDKDEDNEDLRENSLQGRDVNAE